MPSHPPRVLLAVAAWVSLASLLPAEESKRQAFDFFENSIRPLLIQHCVKCHGAKKAESGLRLDSAGAARKGGSSGPAFIPGKPDTSLLLKAVRHQGDLEMPPGKKLNQRQISLLHRWIRDGAAWPQGMTLGAKGPSLRGGPITDRERAFWSFQPPVSPPPPRSQHGQVNNDIDRFLAARLVQAGLNFAPSADRRTLIRRATFDLTGLPPTPTEIDRFLADKTPRAFHKVIDRLLASQAYGERWGRHWLDVVRYADTAGETGDFPTPLSYKYRNWVIRSFNADKPYDEFVREQIAGDLLPAAPRASASALNRYEDRLTATGFIAISRRFGFDVENYHHLTIQDTIDIVGQAFLGLTLGCARCHDHKYDPVNTADYYAWYGIFESTRYSFPGSEQKKSPYDLFPVLRAADARRAKAAHSDSLRQIESRIEHLKARRQSLLGGWKNYLSGQRLKTLSRNRDGHQGFHVWHGDPLPVVGVNTSKKTLMVPGTVPAGKLVVHPLPKEGVGIAWRSPLTGRVSIKGEIRDAHNCGDSVAWFVDHLSDRGLKNVTNGAIKVNGKQLIRVDTLSVRKGDFIQLAVTAKAHHGCDLTQVEFVIRQLGGERRWDARQSATAALLRSKKNDEHKDAWTFYEVSPDRGLTFGKSIRASLVERTPAESRRQLAEADKQLSQLSQQLTAMKKSGPYGLVYGATEGEKPGDAKIRIRGDRHQLGETVPRKNLEILGNDPLPAGSGSGRLQLAKWLTRPRNPLLARVMVNRIWQHHFGRGIVATENDFGARGERPTHPDLLDWLACQFQASGYSIKRMHRLIMASAAYQRSSRFDARAYSADPDARLLWRFNRRRLDAEEIRDAMLFVSRDLDATMGGAHPFPPQKSWAFSQHAPYYGVYPSNRRSIYLMQQRLKRHPFLALFNGADTNVSTARRQLTTVPTQSLYLMNNPFVHKCASGVAKRILASGRDEHGRIEFAYRIGLGRPPSPEETRDAIAFENQYSAAVRSRTGATGSPELTAWSAFCRTLLTRNEFLFVD